MKWYGVHGQVDLGDWSHTVAFCLHGASQMDQDIYVLINAYWEDLNFQIQQGDSSDWRCVADTAMPSPLDLFEPGDEKPLSSLNYEVKARSVVVLLRIRTSDA